MTTIGRVDFKVDFDGKTLPAQARKIGSQMGKNLSDSLQKEFMKDMPKFGRDLADKMQKNGDLAGISLTDAFQRKIKSRRANLINAIADIFESREAFGNFIASSNSVAEGLDKVKDALTRAKDAGAITGKEFNSLSLTGRNWGNTLRDNERDADALAVTMRSRLSVAFGNFKKSLDDTDGSSRKFFTTWKELPHGFRQLVFYIALFASLGSQIAALGSATGSGATVLAGALGALAVGALVAVVAFKGLLAEGAELGPNAQVAADGLREIGNAFSALKSGIQESLFAAVGDSFSRIADIAPQIQAALNGVATAVGTVIGRMAEALGSAEGIEKINALLIGIQPVIVALGDGFIALGSALGTLFIAAMPTIQIFADKFAELMTTFSNFLASVEGQAALEEFFANGVTIFGALLPLIGEAAGLLNSLVTPETVALLVQTLGFLTQLMAPLGDVLGVLAIADPIGLIAQALAQLFGSLAPAMPALMELAQVLNGVLSEAITSLAPVFGQLVTAITPLLTLAVGLAGTLIQALMPALTPLIALFTTLATALAPVVQALASALMPIIVGLTPLITALVVPLQGLIEAVLPVLVTLLDALTPVFGVLIEIITIVISTILPPLVTLLSAVIGAVGELIPEFIALLTPILALLPPLLELIGPILGPLIELLVFLIGAALTPLKLAFTLLGPAIQVVTDIISAMMPFIKGLMTILSGLLTFIVGVFTGNWKKAWTGVQQIFKGVFDSLAGYVKASLNVVVAIINGIISQINNIGGAVGNALGTGALTIPLIPKLAKGTIARMPMTALIGEAGPEAVVPLNRPLSQVDPSVRALSAIAQGKAFAGGSGAGGGGGVTIAEGAIQVVGVSDGRQAASAVMDRFIAAAAT